MTLGTTPLGPVRRISANAVLVAWRSWKSPIWCSDCASDASAELSAPSTG